MNNASIARDINIVRPCECLYNQKWILNNLNDLTIPHKKLWQIKLAKKTSPHHEIRYFIQHFWRVGLW